MNRTSVNENGIKWRLLTTIAARRVHRTVDASTCIPRCQHPTLTDHIPPSSNSPCLSFGFELELSLFGDTKKRQAYRCEQEDANLSEKPCAGVGVAGV